MTRRQVATEIEAQMKQSFEYAFNLESAHETLERWVYTAYGIQMAIASEDRRTCEVLGDYVKETAYKMYELCPMMDHSVLGWE